MMVTAAMFLLQLLVEHICGAHLVEANLALILHSPAPLPWWQLWRLLSYGLLHYDFWHLFWNMLGLWLVGTVLEQALGSARIYIIYALCLLGGALMALLCQATGLTQAPADFVTLMGASAGTIGVLFTFIALAPRSTIYFWCLLIIPIKALYLGYLLAALQIGGLLFNHSSSTSYSAHLGGIIVGLLCAYALRHGWEAKLVGWSQNIQKRWRRRHLRLVK